MKNYRLGNTITVKWTIMTATGTAYNLNASNLELFAVVPNHTIKIDDFSVAGNVVTWTFLGTDQKFTGPYTLTLIENRGQSTMMTVDYCNAFGLVRWSCQAGWDESADVNSNLSLTSEIFTHQIALSKEVQDAIDGNITEYNVSNHFPTDGIDGSNRYTLESAIAKIPESLRNVGIKCSFLNEDGKPETWEWQGELYQYASGWLQVGSGGLSKLESLLNEGYLFAGTATPDTDPGTPDRKVVWIASMPGTYSGFRGFSVKPNTLALFFPLGGKWTKHTVSILYNSPIISPFVLDREADYAAPYSNEMECPCYIPAGTRLYAEVLTELEEDITISVKNADGTVAIAFTSSADTVLSAGYVLQKDIISIYFYSNISQRVHIKFWTDTCDNISNMTANLENKVDKKTSVNIFNYESASLNQFIWSYGQTENREGYGITEYIPVSGNLCINQTVPSGMGHNVYDSTKNRLRTFTDNNYIYQDGDAYVQFTFVMNNALGFQINSGDKPEPFQQYTQNRNDIVRLGGNNVFEVEQNEIRAAVQAASHGMVIRRYGFDIPNGVNGAGDMCQITWPYLDDDVQVDFICLSNMDVSNFYMLSDWGTLIQESKGVLKFTVNNAKGKGLSRSSAYFSIAPATPTSGLKYLRCSRIVITPLTPEASAQCLLKFKHFSFDEYIEVCQAFDSTTDGYGVNRFSSIIEACQRARNMQKPACVRVCPGTYDEFSTRWPVSEDDGGVSYYGIITRSSVKYESFDNEYPELTVLKWNGHDGLDEDVKLTKDEAMRRCIFHVDTYRAVGKTVISGFHIIAENIRYCIHPESAGQGSLMEWEIGHCILEWNGSAQCTSWTGRHLGIGLSVGEKGIVHDTVFTGSVIAGIGGHNNGWNFNRTIYGPKPTIMPGAELIIKKCALNNNNIYMNAYQDDCTTPDTMIIDGCSKVNRVHFGFETDPPIEQTWKGYAINSDIVQNDM